MNAPTDSRAFSGSASVTELPPAARYSLRVALGDAAAISKAIAVDLPSRIGVRASSDRRSALCLGPDEWVVVTSEPDRDALAAAFDGIAEVPFSAVEVSDREITLTVEGPAVLDLLATGCPLDLARMPVGAGTRTVFDTVQIVLTREAEDRFNLTAWRSFMPHVRALLDLAERELGVGL